MQNEKINFCFFKSFLFVLHIKIQKGLNKDIKIPQSARQLPHLSLLNEKAVSKLGIVLLIEYDRTLKDHY